MELPKESGTGQPRSVVVLAVVVAALGYFVDIFDLLLFALIRKASLREVLAAKLSALPADQHDLLLKDWGVWLDNILQMSGLMVGGVLWGVLGDRFGRLTVLFGSILVYSVANLLNAAIADVDPNGTLAFLHTIGLGSAIRQYEVLRFVAGVGLAGELGAGMTLVSELTQPKWRGFATTMIATLGIMGAVVAYFVTQWVAWRMAFVVGGLLGFSLLFLRLGVAESGMWSNLRTKAPRGSLRVLFWPPRRAWRFACVVLIAIPIWFVVGTLVKYGDVIGASLGLPADAKPDPGRSIMWCYVGLAAGDLFSGLLSQWMHSRRKSILLFHLLTIAGMVLYFCVGNRSQSWFYACCLVLGIGSGYWAVFATTAAEQFGTNIRATAATLAPNLVRWSAGGSAALWVWSEKWFTGDPGSAWKAAVVAGVAVMIVSMVALLGVNETYAVNLDYEEAG
ncbi:MAG: MFS transporter [Planctomycetes bacterium]|nr:MFS transporter [Planctomycetota bacterium]